MRVLPIRSLFRILRPPSSARALWTLFPVWHTANNAAYSRITSDGGTDLHVCDWIMYVTSKLGRLDLSGVSSHRAIIGPPHTRYTTSLLH